MPVVGFRALVALLAHTPWHLPNRDLSFVAASPFGAGAGSGVDKMAVASTEGLGSQEGKTHLFPPPQAPGLPSDRSPSCSAANSWTAPGSWECPGRKPGTDNRGSVSRKREDAPSFSREARGAGAPVRRIATPDYFVPRRFPVSEGKRRCAPDGGGGSRFNVSGPGLALPLPVRTYQRPASKEAETVKVPDVVD